MSQLTGLTRGVIKTREIALPDGGSFTVRGLSLPDIMQIYSRHTGELGAWFEKLTLADDGAAVQQQSASIAQSLTTTAPILASEVIAFGSGSGDDETIAIASELPISAQIEALQAIGDLTFSESMPPKKVLEIVIQAAQTAAVAIVPDQEA